MNGEYRNTIDEKGRLMIPPKLREQLGSYTLMLTKSMDNSLWLFTKEDFEALNREVNYGPLAVFNRNSRMIDMMVISPAREIELDKTGRLSIPQILREFAGLEPKSECVILGSTEVFNGIGKGQSANRRPQRNAGAAPQGGDHQRQEV